MNWDLIHKTTAAHTRLSGSSRWVRGWGSAGLGDRCCPPPFCSGSREVTPGAPHGGKALSVTHFGSEPQGRGWVQGPRDFSAAPTRAPPPAQLASTALSSTPAVRPQPAPCLPPDLGPDPLSPQLSLLPYPRGPSAHLPGLPTHLSGAGTRPEPHLGSGDWQRQAPRMVKSITQ